MAEDVGARSAQDEESAGTTGPRRLRSWSFSRLTSYESCPHRLRLTLKGAPVPELEENQGIIIHRLAEQFIKSEIDPLPRELSKFKDVLTDARERFDAGQAEVESEWGFNDDWVPCEWRTAWLRVKCDAVLRPNPSSARIIDWKTGRRDGNEVKAVFQAQLYALAAFMRYPDINAISTEFYFLDKGEVIKRLWDRSKDFPRIYQSWMKRVDVMQNDNVLKPKPSRMACRFCQYSNNPAGSGACGFSIKYEER